MFKPKHPLAFLPPSLGLVVLTLSLLLVVLKTNSPQPVQNTDAKANTELATLSITPGSESLQFNDGSFYSAGIILSSDATAIKRADVKVHFDPTVVNVDPKLALGSVFDTMTLSGVDNNRGVVYLAGENIDAKSASGILASFRFRPLKPGVINFAIEFSTPRASGDSRVLSSSGTDILSRVDNAQYLINH